MNMKRKGVTICEQYSIAKNEVETRTLSALSPGEGKSELILDGTASRRDAVPRFTKVRLVLADAGCFHAVD